MNPPPPRLPASGSTTASANPTATAASTALPPCWMISIPTWLASGWPDTIMARGPPDTLMTAPDFLDPRLTEQRNSRTARIDVAATLEIVDLINTEDATVAAAVRAVRAEIARAIDLVVEAFKQGGRLVYVGAGTS